MDSEAASAPLCMASSRQEAKTCAESSWAERHAQEAAQPPWDAEMGDADRASATVRVCSVIHMMR